MKYEIARPSLRNIDLSSNLILVGVQIATLAQAALALLRSRDTSAVRERRGGWPTQAKTGLERATRRPDTIRSRFYTFEAWRLTLVPALLQGWPRPSCLGTWRGSGLLWLRRFRCLPSANRDTAPNRSWQDWGGAATFQVAMRCCTKESRFTLASRERWSSGFANT